MKSRIWQLWIGLALSVAAFITYFTFFVRFPSTRDVPWVNVLLFLAAMVLLVRGVIGARRKILAGIVVAIGAGIFVFFLVIVTVGTKQLPPVTNAPRVGQAAPQFALVDTHRTPATLQSLLASSPRGVLLIFYRGYW